MSQNVEGVKASNGGTREEENMHESSKRAFNNQNTTLVNPDDELLSWLQYPIDDDIFHHWPPPPTTSPAPPAPPASADFFSSSFSSSPLFSSSLAVKHLPQLEHEGFMVARDLDRRVVVDDWILHKEDMEIEFFQGNQSTALKNKGVVIGQEGTSGVKDHYEAYHLDNREGERRAGVWGQEGTSGVKDHYEAYHLDNREGEKRAGVWASRLLDWKQGFVKDCRTLAQLKQETECWATREAQVVAAKGAPHPMHSPSEKAIRLNGEQDTHMMLTAHSPQNAEDKGLQITSKVKEESLLQFAQASNEEYWLQNDMDMKLNRKKGTPLIGRLQAHSNADAALALGAGRATGALRSPGMEAFSKVRTSLQPTQPVPLGSPTSSSFPLSRTLSGKNLFSPSSCNWMATASRPLGSPGSMPASQLSYQTSNPAQLLVSKPYGNFSNMVIQENQLNFKGNTKNIKDNITKTSSSEQLPTVPFLSPQEGGTPIDGTQNLLIPEETMAGGSSSAGAPSDPDTTDLQKLSSVSFLSQERRTAGSTCSGGSQTSESLREPGSGIKRKLSECQSEEAEEDSVVSTQARTSTSKRPRTSGVHNLSERRRRNKINDKMNALRELIPNASKSNKAALLDEAIDYLKNLQLQLQVMSLRTGGVSMMPMALPPSMPHMPIPQYGSLGSMGMDLSGGSALASAVSTMGIESHSFSQFQVLPGQFQHPHVQASSQITFPRREEQQQ